MSDFAIYKRLEAARVSSNTELSANGATSVVSQSHRRAIAVGFADANITAVVAETVVLVAPYACSLPSANITVPAAIASSGSNYAVLTLAKRYANGVSGGTVATANLASTAVAAFVPVAFTLASPPVQFAAGDTVTLAVAKASGGAYLANGASALLDVVIEDI